MVRLATENPHKSAALDLLVALGDFVDYGK